MELPGCYGEFNQLVFHHEGNTAALFLDDTFEIDAAIDEEEDMTRFGILGSDRTLPQSQK